MELLKNLPLGSEFWLDEEVFGCMPGRYVLQDFESEYKMRYELVVNKFGHTLYLPDDSEVRVEA